MAWLDISTASSKKNETREGEEISVLKNRLHVYIEYATATLLAYAYIGRNATEISKTVIFVVTYISTRDVALLVVIVVVSFANSFESIL